MQAWEQLQDNLKCLEVTLSPEQLQKLNQVSQIELGFPHDFLDSDIMHSNSFSGAYDLIDHPRQLTKNSWESNGVDVNENGVDVNEVIVRLTASTLLTKG